MEHAPQCVGDMPLEPLLSMRPNMGAVHAAPAFAPAAR